VPGLTLGGGSGRNLGAMTKLAQLNLLVFALLVAHTLDHAVNQPQRDLPATGGVIALLGFLILAASATLAVRRSPLAPAASAVAGTVTAAGFVAIHVLPQWSSAISDPYWDFSANAISWVLLVAPLLASIALAIAGARGAREEQTMDARTRGGLRRA
jgi:hypothetical protein